MPQVPVFRRVPVCYDRTMQDVPPSRPDPDLGPEIRALRTEVARLNNHRFVRIHNSMLRLVSFQFLRGLAFGFGTAVGASLLVTFVAYALSNIDFLPLIGEWAAEIARQIQSEVGAGPQP